jgi:hypothetical protein
MLISKVGVEVLITCEMMRPLQDFEGVALHAR